MANMKILDIPSDDRRWGGWDYTYTSGRTQNGGNLHFRGQFDNTNKGEDTNSVF